MASVRSKVYFIILTTLLVGGFPNFMAQEAHAAVQLTAGSCTINLDTNTVSLAFTDSGSSGATDITALVITDINFDDGSSTALTSDSSVDISGGSVLTIPITLGSLDKYNLNQEDSFTSCVIDTVTDNIGTTLTVTDSSPSFTVDSTAPTISTAVLDNSAKTLTLTFDSGVSIPTITGYTINGDGNSHTLTGGSVSGTEGSTSYTLTYNDADKNSINGLTFDSTSTVTVASANVNDGQVNIAAATVSLSTGGITAAKNGSGCGNCEAPTLGVNSESKRIVENGFTYNGRSVDAERFFTPYPLITANVGKQNTAVFKIYEDKGPENVKHFAFAFGLEKSDIISNSKAMIELDIDHEGTETVTVTDPENALDNIKVSTNIENCNGDDSDTQCLIVTINHRFRAPLDFNVVATDVWDMQRNSWQNYFNHGIEVVGESLNLAKEYDGINAGHIYHLTETSKTTTVDEFGSTWSFQYGVWEMDYVKNERVQDTSSVFTRNHSDFAEYKELQFQNTIPQLLEICPTCLDSFTDFDDSFSHEYSNELNALDDPEIIQKMILENERAQKIMNYLLDPVLKYK